ncbi:hypothetical protein PLICRDRAFT_182431 [Plicaturopsis crispa FD-325 SS-3]|nr:hypothetical protein PLICRDRAFT_182431 [Plicaturopsis crispa FD-325 SS-3]
MSGAGHESINGEIEQIEPQEKELVDDSTCVESHLSHLRTEAAHSGIVRHAPITSLPAELLSRIFENIIALHKPSKRFSAPYRLLCVTKYWQRIVLSTSSLWTSVNFNDGPAMLPLLTQHLERSRKRPLDIHLNPMSAATFDQLCPLMELSRCRRLRIYTESTDRLCNILAHISGTEAPLLEWLSMTRHLDNYMPNDLPIDARPCILTGGAPKLAYLHLEGIPPQLFMPPSGGFVTTFHFCMGRNNILSYPEFRDMLTKLPVVEKLILEGWIVQFFDDSLPAIDFPSLTTLIFSGILRGPQSVTDMVRVMRAPRLQRLSLCQMDAVDVDGVISELSHGLKFPELRSLKLDRACICLETATRNLIIRSPEVTELIIGDWCWYEWEGVKKYYTRNKHELHMHLLEILGTTTVLVRQEAWPDLRTITIESLGLDDRPNDYYAFETDRGFGHALLECLRARRSENMPVQVLRLHPDILRRASPQTLAALRDEVQAVERYEGKGANWYHIERRPE